MDTTTGGNWPTPESGPCSLHAHDPCDCAQRLHDAGRSFQLKADNLARNAQARPVVQFFLVGARDFVVAALIAGSSIAPSPSHGPAPSHPPRHSRLIEAEQSYFSDCLGPGGRLISCAKASPVHPLE